MKNRYDYICEEVQQAKDSLCSNPSDELLFYYRGHSDIDWDLVPTIIRSRRKVTEHSEICRAMNDGNWSLADSASRKSAMCSTLRSTVLCGRSPIIAAV